MDASYVGTKRESEGTSEAGGGWRGESEDRDTNVVRGQLRSRVVVAVVFVVYSYTPATRALLSGFPRPRGQADTRSGTAGIGGAD